MASLSIQTEVHLRDDKGRFLAALDRAETDALRQVLIEVEDSARAGAPRASGALAGTVFAALVNSRYGVVGAGTDHAMPQEEGAGPHLIPNAFGWGITVEHPGNPATHFLSDALRGAANKLVDAIAARI